MIFFLPGGIEVSIVYPIGVEDGRRKGVSVSRTGIEATFEFVDLDDVDPSFLEYEYEKAPPTLRDEEVQAFGLGHRVDAGRRLTDSRSGVAEKSISAAILRRLEDTCDDLILGAMPSSSHKMYNYSCTRTLER